MSIKKVESEVKIYESKSYHLFKNIKGNRNVNQKRVEKIVKEILLGVDMLPYVPVVIDEQFGIIDGQHRFEASKKSNKPVYYVMRPRVTIQDIAAINKHSEKWAMKDFLNCYVQLNIKDYLILDKFIDDHKFITLPLALQLLDTKRAPVGLSTREAFKDGKFKVDDLEEATVSATLVNTIAPFCDGINRTLVSTLIRLRLFGKYNHRTMLNKLDWSKTRIRNHNQVKDCLAEFEAIYNWRQGKRVVIF